MPQFDITSFSSQIFWLSVIFTFLYFLVNKIIAPKAESIINARDRYLEENIRYADEYNDKIKSIETIKTEHLEEIHALVEDTQKQAVEMLEMHFDTEQKALKNSLNKKRSRALEEINDYVDKFHDNEADACINLASFIIKKITNKPANLKLLKQIHSKV